MKILLRLTFFIVTIIFCACGNHRSVIKKSEDDVIILDTINDNFDNHTYLESLEAWRSQKRTERFKDSVKVHYRDTLYSLNYFEKNIGFENVKKAKLRIIQDSILIKERYNLVGCLRLIVIK